jgi:hypothetical protein
VSDHELGYPFANSFDIGVPRPDYVGLTRASAEERADQQRLSTRVLELPVVGDLAWRADRRSSRVNLVVEGGVVIRAAVF